jgi:hypothetical protein
MLKALFYKNSLLMWFCMILLMLFFLPSCSMLPKNDNSQPKRVLDSSTYKSALPSDFSGPYADSFAMTISHNPYDFVYSIVKDSKITQEEFILSQNTFKTCVNNLGFGVHFADNTYLQGAFLVEAADPSDGSIRGSTDELTEKCISETGYEDIARIYYQMIVNPDRQDLSNYIAECLVKFNYKKAGYTGQDYSNESRGSLLSASGYGTAKTKIGSNINQVDADGEEISSLGFIKCQNDPKAVLSEK